MSNKIIWVFGPSAAGKETFLRFIEEKKPKEVIERMKWGNCVLISRKSIENVALSRDDVKKEYRKNLNNEVVALAKKNPGTTILVKGQDLDFEYGHLDSVKTALPDSIHEIVFLIIDFDELYERYTKKVWWEESMTKKVLKEWTEEHVENIQKFQEKGFKVTALDSSGDQYTKIPFPPKLPATK